MRTSFALIIALLAFTFGHKPVFSQCGITHYSDTSAGVGVLDFYVDFSALTDPGKGSAILNMYNWEGVWLDGMNFDSSFTYMNFIHPNNENLYYELEVYDSTTTCHDTINGTATITSVNTNFLCDANFDYSSDSLNMDFIFESTAPYNPPSSTYNWTFEWNAFGTDNPASHTFSSNIIQDYVVALNVQGPDCFYTNAYLEDTLSAGYLPPCLASFDLIGDSLNQATYYAYNYSYGNFIDYFWDFGDGNTSTDTFPTHTYTSVGDFEICLTVNDTSGCQSTFCDTINVVVKSGTTFIVLDGFSGGSKEFNQNVFKIYPNPTDGILFINYSANKNDQAQLLLFDASGRIVFDQILPAKMGANKYEIHLPELKSGVYFYRLNHQKGKLIIE